MSTTIESLELEVLSSSQSAESGLDALTASLEKLKKATSGGVGLTSVIKQIKGLGDAAKSVDSTSINNLNGLTKAISTLSNLGGVKLSSTIATQITAIGDSAKTLNGVNFAPISDLANSLAPLSAIGKINLGSVINQLNRIPELANTLNSSDMSGFASKIRELVTALQPLSEMPKQTISSTLTQIKKIPEIFAGLQSVDMGAFSAKIQELATALKPLADEMNKVAAGFSAFPAKIQRLIANTNSLTASNNKASSSYVNFYAKIKMAVTAVRTIATKIASCITTMNDYIENVNLFTASMGKYADKAREYAETVGEVMGIDPGEWMRNQGVFMTLATGFGVAGDRAYLMSQQLTQLGYDLSSFFNISYEDAMQKLQSGISGELEPLRRLGYDLSQAKLQAVALSLGIDKSVSSMTQAEKAQLRYYAIMTQVTTAQGDMSRTLNAPANQLRILKARLTQAARAIGSIFIPALNAILPYAIAVAQVVRYLASAIASLFGFEMPEVDYSGIDSVTGGAEDASGALDDAAESAKKLQKYMMGFDELNVINPNEDNGLGLEDALGGGQFDFELPTYDFISDATESRVAEIVEDMKEWLGITGEIDSWSDLLNTRLGNILTTVGLIGAGIAAWKVTKTFFDSIAALKALLASPTYSIAIGVILTLTGFTIEFSGLKDAVTNGLEGFNFAEIVGGGIIGTGGAALLGSTLATWIETAFAGSAVDLAITQAGINLGVGTVGAAGAAIGASVAGIIAGLPAYFVGIYDACVEGIDWLSGLLIGAGATAAGAGIGAIIGMCGGPIGAGVGALIGLAVGLVTDLVILIVQEWDVIVEWCSTACAAIGGFFTGLWEDICSVWSVVSEWFNVNIIQPVAGFFSELWEGISNAASVCWNAIVEFFSPAVEWFSQLFNSIWQTISDVFYNIGVIASGCWEIIKAVWAIVSEWFNVNIIQPVATFFTGLWSSISTLAISAWENIKSVFSTIGSWINTNIIQPVGNFFTGLWNGFVDKAKKAWEGVKNVFSKVATFFSDTFKKAWQGIVKVFSVAGEIFVDIKDGIVSAFKFVVNGIIKGLNKVVAIPFNGINSALNWIKGIEIVGIKPFGNLKTINVPQIPLLSGGGVPATGQMFIAREAGAELVGNVGHKTAVMNNDQIVESVSDGVYRAVLAAMRQSDGGETAIYIDGRRVFEVVKNYNNRERIRTGVNPLMG